MKINKSKFAALSLTSLLVVFAFQNCGDFKVTKSDLSSTGGVEVASLGFLVPAVKIYGFTSDPNQKQILPVQQYQMGDTIISSAIASAIANPSKIKTLATSPAVVKWPGGEIPFYFDPNSGFTAAEVATLRANLLAACGRWAQVTKVKCTEITSASPALTTGSVLPYLVVTQSNVPLPWVSRPEGFCGVGSSCTTIGYAGNNGVSHYAIHKSLINNMWNLTHELGHALGLYHEHQRPGRDNYISVRSDMAGDGNFAIINSLNAVNNDYDYASIMHYSTVGSRNADFVAGAGSIYLAFRTGQQFQTFTAMHRSALNFGVGSRGLAVNLPGYPSIQDSDNARALYGAPAVTNQSCQLSGGQRAMPHGTRIGIFVSQSPASATSGYCDVEPRLCVNGTLTGGDGLEHYSNCEARCNIAGTTYDYASRVTYYKISTGTQAQCDANRMDVFCDTTVMLAPVAGFPTCTVSTTPPVTTCPLPLQKTLTSSANNLGAVNTCVFNLTAVNAGSASSVTSTVVGSSYSLLCQSNLQWATSPQSAVCPAPAAGVLTCPAIQKTATSAANNVGATNSCVFSLSSTNANVLANAVSSIAGSSYALMCQSNGQWATTATSTICPAPANAVLACTAVQKTVVSAANNVGSTNSCIFNLPATNGNVVASAVSTINGSSYSLKCESTGQWATTATTSVCPAPPAGLVVCAPIRRSITSSANAMGATNTCVFDFASTTANTNVTVAGSVPFSSCTLPCLSTGQWASAPASSFCPAPAVTISACPLPLQKTVTSAPNNVGATNTCVFNLTAADPGVTSTVTASPAISGSSYSLMCQSNSQWAASPTNSVCPAPANVIINDECPTLANQTQMSSGSCLTGNYVSGSLSFQSSSDQFMWSCRTCDDISVLAISTSSLVCTNQRTVTCTAPPITCPAGQTRIGNGRTEAFSCITTPVPGANCTSQAVPLLCSVNGVVKTVNAQLNLTAAPGTITAEMTNQSSMTSLAFASPAIDYSKSYRFRLQWVCNSNSQWQFSHPSGDCNFQSVYNSAGGATCDRFSYSPLECTCTDNIGGTKVFPFVGQVSHTVCDGGESGGCYEVIDTPGTCDGKIPTYIPPPDTGGGY